jgi:hypothetical protein
MHPGPDGRYRLASHNDNGCSGTPKKSHPGLSTVGSRSEADPREPTRPDLLRAADSNSDSNGSDHRLPSATGDTA